MKISDVFYCFLKPKSALVRQNLEKFGIIWIFCNSYLTFRMGGGTIVISIIRLFFVTAYGK